MFRTEWALPQSLYITKVCTLIEHQQQSQIYNTLPVFTKSRVRGFESSEPKLLGSSRTWEAPVCTSTLSDSRVLFWLLWVWFKSCFADLSPSYTIFQTCANPSDKKMTDPFDSHLESFFAFSIARIACFLRLRLSASP